MRERTFDDPTNCFWTRWPIILIRYPTIQLSQLIRLNADLNLDSFACRGGAAPFLWYQRLAFHKNNGTKEKSDRQDA
jgi:hypothetical protein